MNTPKESKNLMLAAAEKLAAGGAPPQEPCASDRGRPKEAEASSAGDEAVKPREAETAALQREVLFMAERLRVLELDNELLRREAEESRHALEPLAHHRAVVLLLEAANEKVRAHEEHICFLDAALSKAELRRAKAEARADKARAALLTKEHELGGAVLMQRLVEMKKGFGPILNAPPGATSTSTRATATAAIPLLPRAPPGAPFPMVVAAGRDGARVAKAGFAAVDAPLEKGFPKSARARLPSIARPSAMPSSARERHLGGLMSSSGSPRRTHAHDDVTSSLHEKALAVLHDIEAENLQPLLAGRWHYLAQE
jgi:hypothetical protein